MWRPWYASIWAEAAVLAAHPDAAAIRRARWPLTVGNPIARPSCTGPGLAAHGDAGPGCDLVARPRPSTALGARYQWARTLVMLGGEDRVRGLAELAAMGATPMAWPP